MRRNGTNENITHCYKQLPVYQIGSDQSALIIAIIFICVVLIVTLYAVHHKFFDPYLEKARNNLCKGASAVEPAVADASAIESQPLSAKKPSHVVVNPVSAGKNDDYGTHTVKSKNAAARTESRHEDTIAESAIAPLSASKDVSNEIGKNNINSEADF